MAVLGWLHASIKVGDNYSPRITIVSEYDKVLPHLDYFVEINRVGDYNVPNSIYYLLDILEDMGFYRNGAMGLIPLDFKEIKAFLEISDIDLDYEDIVLLRSLSHIYTTEVQSDEKAINPTKRAGGSNAMTIDDYNRIMNK